MGQLDQLLAAVKDAAQAESDLEARVDGLIAALKAPHDGPEVAEAISELEALKSRASGFQSSTGEAQASGASESQEVDTAPLPDSFPSAQQAGEEPVLSPDAPVSETTES